MAEGNKKNKISTKKLVIITILVTILIEILLGIIAVIIVYINYEKLTAADSGVSDNIVQKELKDLELDLDFEEKENANKSQIIGYDGIFGKIDFNEEKNSDKKEYLFSKLVDINVYLEEINTQITLKSLANKRLLDKYIYSALLKSDKLEEDVKQLLTFHSLLGKISVADGDLIINEINAKKIEVQNALLPLIKMNNYEGLSNYLTNLEKDLKFSNNALSTNIYASDTMINNEDFQYIVSKLYSPDYYNNIKEVSIKTGVDEKLIMSSIGVEQIRYMTTDRGYAKEMIKQNMPLTTFNKFSYGVGGIKFETFKKINSDLKTYDSQLYEKYFKEYDLLANIEKDGGMLYSDYNIQQVLEDNYSGILYSAGLIFNIEKKWELAGYSISHDPGIIITLYNMGNDKTPHSTPDVGGSRIYIDENNTYYFGELGYIMYYYMKYYL